MSSVSESVSEDEWSEHSSEDISESSEMLEENFGLASDEFVLPYEERVEPIATEEEIGVHAEQAVQEEEEILWSRFSGK